MAQLSAVDLHVEWEQILTDVHDGVFQPEPSARLEDVILWNPAVIFAPNQALRYIVHTPDKAQRISLSLDGAHLFLTGMDSDPAKPYPIEWTEVLDTARL